MKNFLLMLIVMASLFACKGDAVKDPSVLNEQQKQDLDRTLKQMEEAAPDLERPGTGKGKGKLQQVNATLINLTVTTYGRDSIVLDWDTPPMNSGDYIMWTFVNRKFTFPDGQVFLLKDGYGQTILTSDWQSIMPGGYMFQPTRLVLTSTSGITTFGIEPGTYEFYVSGGTGLPYDSPNWAIYITNHVTVTVL